jgi:hypothetical protein
MTKFTASCSISDCHRNSPTIHGILAARFVGWLPMSTGTKEENQIAMLMFIHLPV